MDEVFNFIIRSFNEVYNTSPIDLNKYRNFESKDCFQYLLSIDIAKDTYEVPAILTNVAIQAKLKGYSEVCMPIINNNSQAIINRRTLKPIMKDFLNSSYKSIQAVKTSKGDIYYGYPGIILDQDYDPLIVFTCVISKGTIINYRCKISNKVFIHQNNLMEKAILKKFLPTLTTEFVDIEPRFEGVFIGDINLVVKPTTPPFNKDINEDINNFLIENIEDII